MLITVVSIKKNKLGIMRRERVAMTDSKRRISLLGKLAILILMFVCVTILQAKAVEEECLIIFDESTNAAPLYDEPKRNSKPVGYCRNAVTVTLLNDFSEEWSYIRLGGEDVFIEGYVERQYLQPIDSPLLDLSKRKVVQVNSINVGCGAPLYTSWDRLETYMPNGNTVTVYLENPAGWSFVRYWSYETNKMIYGYAATNDLTASLDDSSAFYPRDPRVAMKGFSYVFNGFLPKDVTQAFAPEAWSNTEPILGAIAANGGRQAFIIVKKRGINYLCYLLKKDGRWEIQSAMDKVLYQDGSTPIGISFSADGRFITITYEETPNSRHVNELVFRAPYVEADINQWEFVSGYYDASHKEFSAGAHQDNKLIVLTQIDHNVQLDEITMPMDSRFLLPSFDISWFYALLVN